MNLNCKLILDFFNEQDSFKFEILQITGDSLFIISQTFERPVIFEIVYGNVDLREGESFPESTTRQDVENIYNCKVFPIAYKCDYQLQRALKIMQQYLLNADYIVANCTFDLYINIIRAGVKVTHHYHHAGYGRITYTRGRCQLLLDFEYTRGGIWDTGDINISKFNEVVAGYYPIRNGWYKANIGNKRIIQNVGLRWPGGFASVFPNILGDEPYRPLFKIGTVYYKR